MKKILSLFIMLFLLVGCSKNELTCYKKDVAFEQGKMDRYVTFAYDKENYITSSIINEIRKYDNESDAFTFLDNNSEHTEKISDTELSYTERKEYDEKVLASDIKHAMEAQEYTCNYK